MPFIGKLSGEIHFSPDVDHKSGIATDGIGAPDKAGV